jgi:hypothetical protein
VPQNAFLGLLIGHAASILIFASELLLAAWQRTPRPQNRTGPLLPLRKP